MLVKICQICNQNPELKEIDDVYMRARAGEDFCPRCGHVEKLRTEFLIPEANLEKFQAKIAKLQKIAVKLGVEPAKAERGKDVMRPVRDDRTGFETGEFERLISFTVEGINPKFSGWTFAATLEVMESGNLIKRVPSAGEIPERYRQEKLVCEHCQKIRMRSNYFIVQHEDGTFKSVGRSCLKDFLGHQDPARIASFMEISSSLRDDESDEGFGGGGGGRRMSPEFGVLTVLTIALVYIRKYGFLSKKKMQELMQSGMYSATTTADQVEYYLVSPSAGDRDAQEAWNEEHQKHQPTDEDKALAADIKNWMLSLGDKYNATEFDHNLCMLAKEEFIRVKHFSFVAAAAMMGAKHLDRLVVEKKKLADKSNQHVGTIGERREFALTVTRMRSFESGYGEATIITLEDAEGNSYQWWASKHYETLEKNGIREGEKFTVTATVKKHDWYKERAQTSLTRCKFKELK